jgi:hypothetical protein
MSASPDPERLAGLLFELASQLHVERTRRIALETALERAGLLEPGAADALAEDPALLARAREGLDRSMQGLMRILTEADDPRAPLRGEAVPKTLPRTLKTSE